jgi:hypothetical protein
MTHINSSCHDKGDSQKKAFGKFILGKALPLRTFEIYLKIKGRNGPQAWKSELPSVQNLLNHLLRYTQSESSREKYLRHLVQFCIWTGFRPEEVIKLNKLRVEQFVQNFVDGLATTRARAY